MAEIKPDIESFASIKVVGVGGSGGSAVNRMITSKIRGVDFIVMNTDIQALHYNQAPTKIHIGKSVTRGLGAGMDPEMGAKAAEEAQNEIREALKGADMVFVTCGLGGGTGSGAGPKVAAIAREMGALTVAVVTRPFLFEGAQRKSIADAAHERLAEVVDTIITIPNDRVLQIIDRKTSLLDAFEIVDDVLRQGVQGISELITVHGMINVDFADIRAIMANRGSALMGIGRSGGENRAVEAAKAATSSPLLEASIDGAKGILFTITGGSNLSMFEVSEAAKIVTQSADPNAKVIFGAVVDESLKDEVKVTVIATGFEQVRQIPRPRNNVFSGTLSASAAAAIRPASSESTEDREKSTRPATTPAPAEQRSAPAEDRAPAPVPATPPQPQMPPQPQPMQVYPPYGAMPMAQAFAVPAYGYAMPPQPMYAQQPPPPIPQSAPPRIAPIEVKPLQEPEPLEPVSFASRPVTTRSSVKAAPPVIEEQEEEELAEEEAEEEVEEEPPAPPPKIASKQPHLQPPQYAQPQTRPSMPPARPPAKTEEDVLEIPAFLRRKMM